MATIKTFTTADTLGAADPEIIMTIALWVYKAQCIAPKALTKAAAVLAIFI